MVWAYMQGKETQKTERQGLQQPSTMILAAQLCVAHNQLTV
jgi:hypothetical protein